MKIQLIMMILVMAASSMLFLTGCATSGCSNCSVSGFRSCDTCYKAVTTCTTKCYKVEKPSCCDYSYVNNCCDTRDYWVE